MNMDADVMKDLRKWAYGLQVQHRYQLFVWNEVRKIAVTRRLYNLLEDAAREQEGNLGADFVLNPLRIAGGILVECSDGD